MNRRPQRIFPPNKTGGGVSNAIRVRPSPGVAKRFPWRVIIFFLVIAAIAGVVFLVIPMLSATRRPVVDWCLDLTKVLTGEMVGEFILGIQGK